MSTVFKKKIFTFKTLLKDLFFFIINFPRIGRMMKSKQVGRALMEKIMTVTTAVNGCVYCAWFHAKQALKCGISENEVNNLLDLQFKTHADPDEMMALLFAQHYAETNRNPDPEMTQNLLEAYGEEKANHILLIIRMINFGNLYGNTWDAVISRFKGSPALKSNLVFEMIFFLGNLPVMFPAMILIRQDKHRV